LNQLFGSIPPEIGNLASLRALNHFHNQLSGIIPLETWTVASLGKLCLSSSKLSGSTPPEIGNLTGLRSLRLHGNHLRSEIPTQLTNLTNLTSLNPLDLRWNALYTTNPTVQVFLDANQPGWNNTQSVAPINVSTVGLGATSILVSWSPVSHVADPGGYEIHTNGSSGGPYGFLSTVAERDVPGFPVSGLVPFCRYYSVVKTYTDPDAKTQNRVVSDPSVEVFTRTPVGLMRFSVE
jgi:hypothetical protein